MSDKKQMTEDQAKEIWDKCTVRTTWEHFRWNLEAIGYTIKKSAIEEAKNLYEAWSENIENNSCLSLLLKFQTAVALVQKQHEAIQELKQKLEAQK